MGGGQSGGLDFYETHCDERPLSTFVVDPSFGGVIHSAFVEAFKEKPEHVWRLVQNINRALEQETPHDPSAIHPKDQARKQAHARDNADITLEEAKAKIQVLKQTNTDLRKALGVTNKELLEQPGKVPHDAMMIEYAEAAKAAAVSWQLNAGEKSRKAEQTKESIMVRERHHRSSEGWFITQNLLPLRAQLALLEQNKTLAMEMATQLEERFSQLRERLRERFVPLLLHQQSNYVERFNQYNMLDLDALWELLRKLDSPHAAEDPWDDEFDSKPATNFEFENTELQLLALKQPTQPGLEEKIIDLKEKFRTCAVIRDSMLHGYMEQLCKTVAEEYRRARIRRSCSI